MLYKLTWSFKECWVWVNVQKKIKNSFRVNSSLRRWCWNWVSMTFTLVFCTQRSFQWYNPTTKMKLHRGHLEVLWKAFHAVIQQPKKFFCETNSSMEYWKTLQKRLRILLASRWNNKDILPAEAQTASLSTLLFFFKVSLVFNLGMFQILKPSAYYLLGNTKYENPSFVFFSFQTRHHRCLNPSGRRRRGQMEVPADVRWAPSAWFVAAGGRPALRWGAGQTPAESGRRSPYPPSCRRRCSPWWLPLGPLRWRSPGQRSWRRNTNILLN